MITKEAVEAVAQALHNYDSAPFNKKLARTAAHIRDHYRRKAMELLQIAEPYQSDPEGWEQVGYCELVTTDSEGREVDVHCWSEPQFWETSVAEGNFPVGRVHVFRQRHPLESR